MKNSDLSGPPAPDVLAALGSLREGVAAIQNLQHLLVSRDVSTQTLDQVVPDVAASLVSWYQITHGLVSYAQRALKLEALELDPFKLHASQAAGSSLEALNEAASGPIRAKQRLSVERRLNSSLPAILSSLSNIELLVDATCALGVPMSISELLSSAPDNGGNRPQRQVGIGGAVDSAMVSIPASIGLRCLGVLAGRAEAEDKSTVAVGQRLGIHVEETPQQILLELRMMDSVGETVQLPIYQPTLFAQATVQAVLRPYGGSLLAPHRGLVLPPSR